MSTDDADRYERYWSEGYTPGGQRQRDQAIPGTRSITDQKLSGETGIVYTRETIYDGFGRRIGNNDYTDHGRQATHTAPHYHIRDPVTGERDGPFPGLHPNTP